MKKLTLWIVVTAWSAWGADCDVESLKRIGTVGAGLDWHPTDSNQIAIARPDDHGNHQVHLIRADGSEIRCLTCQSSNGAPAIGVHKGVPHWLPNGRYIFLQVEQENHKGNRALSTPGSGRFNDIWATTPEADRWWRLTDGSRNAETGTLFPVPSRHGDRLAWAERFAAARHPFQAMAGLLRGDPPSDIWGRWRLNIADLQFAANGDVALRNIQPMNPGNGDFYEMQVWGQGDRSILFASSIDRPSPYLIDIWRLDLGSRKLTRVSGATEHWEEHVALSPGFSKAVFMSSECCRWNSKDLKTLEAELYLMNADGSNRLQLTHFNEAGAKEYSPDIRSVVAKGVWSPDGRKVAFARILIDASSGKNRSTDLWMLSFAGTCGI